jgi:hypothetical protein
MIPCHSFSSRTENYIEGVTLLCNDCPNKIEIDSGGKNTMDNLENILKSLLPLILIILFSWVFSYLSRKKKQLEPAKNAATERGQAEDLLDIFSGRSGQQPMSSEAAAENLPPLPSAATRWAPRGGLAPPPVTADPIKPKMWGA